MSYRIPLESPPTSPIAPPTDLDTPVATVSSPVADNIEQTYNNIINVPSDIELFLRNLKLLDLHLLSDWPRITKDTFRPEKDARVKQKARVTKAEWVLYRLFEIWDEAGTRAKLEQYFPPHEPVQSIKLRSGLYQLLNNLKQDGVLGPSCTLRKSMLDECKGDKFEDLLFLFSTAVLKKVVAVRQEGRSLPVAQDLGIKAYVSNQDEQSLPLLSLVHHASTRSSLQQRDLHKARLRALEQRYAEDERSIEQRQTQTMSALESHLTKLIDAQVDTSKLKRQLRDECPGDRTWLNTILSGDVYEGHDPKIEADFGQIWKSTVNDEATKYEDTPRGLLVDLNRRVEEQRARLAEWKAFQKELSKRNESLIAFKSPFKSPMKSSAKPSPKSPAKSPKKTPHKRTQSPTKTFTGRLLSADQPSNSPPLPVFTPDHRFQAVSRDLSSVTSAEGPPQESLLSITDQHPRIDQDSPLEAKLQALTMDNSVHSPSPVKRDLRPSANKMLPPPRPLHQRSRSDVPPSASKFATQSQIKVDDGTKIPASPQSPVTSSVSTAASYTNASVSLTERTRQSMSFAGKPSRHGRSSSVTSLSSSVAETPSKPPIQYSSEEASSAALNPAQLTLAERTQQSMLLMSSKKAESLNTKPSPSQSTGPSRSMSMKRPPVSTAPKPSYPVNPFDSPDPQRMKVDAEEQTADQAPLNSKTTPTETAEDVWPTKEEYIAPRVNPSVSQEVHTPQHQSQKDEEISEYESVFKTRSKMRRSPPPSMSTNM